MVSRSAVLSIFHSNLFVTQAATKWTSSFYLAINHFEPRSLSLFLSLTFSFFIRKHCNPSQYNIINGLLAFYFHITNSSRHLRYYTYKCFIVHINIYSLKNIYVSCDHRESRTEQGAHANAYLWLQLLGYINSELCRESLTYL